MFEKAKTWAAAHRLESTAIVVFTLATVATAVGLTQLSFADPLKFLPGGRR